MKLHWHERMGRFSLHHLTSLGVVVAVIAGLGVSLASAKAKAEDAELELAFSATASRSVYSQPFDRGDLKWLLNAQASVAAQR
jgi:hypothetical protein